MIKKFDEFINENIFDGIGKRSKGGSVRKEDGTYVDTILGIKVLLENPNNVNLIEDILNEYSAYEITISKLSDLTGYYSTEKIKKIKNSEDPYSYIIYDGKNGTSLVAEFTTYEDILDFELDDDFETNTSEKDYISLCKCIATAFKEVGNYFDYVPSRNSWVLDKSGDISEYEKEYIFKLIDESDSYNWLVDHEDEADTYLEDFKESITSEFPELNDETFICWSYRDGCSIGIPLNTNNLLNIKKYVEFTKQWFEL